MPRNEFKDGAIVNTNGINYLVKNSSDFSCNGCSFNKGYDVGCSKPDSTPCFEDDTYYIYIKQES